MLAGSHANSIALIGFGMDSFIESLSASIMIWRLHVGSRLSEEHEARVEQKAVRLIAYTFFVLAAYIAYESLNKLYHQEVADPSMLGIIIAIVSLLIMPALFLAKHRTGHKMAIRSLLLDAKQTMACMLLSVSLLVGTDTQLYVCLVVG